MSLETFSIQILFFKNLFHLNSKSKENFLNIEVYGGFIILLLSAFLKVLVWKNNCMCNGDNACDVAAFPDE